MIPYLDLHTRRKGPVPLTYGTALSSNSNFGHGKRGDAAHHFLVQGERLRGLVCQKEDGLGLLQIRGQHGGPAKYKGTGCLRTSWFPRFHDSGFEQSCRRSQLTVTRISWIGRCFEATIRHDRTHQERSRMLSRPYASVHLSKHTNRPSSTPQHDIDDQNDRGEGSESSAAIWQCILTARTIKNMKVKLRVPPAKLTLRLDWAPSRSGVFPQI
jgi:hypothetical protein